MFIDDDPNLVWELWQQMAREWRRDRAHPTGPTRGGITRDDACAAIHHTVQLLGRTMTQGGQLDPMVATSAAGLLLIAREYVLPAPTPRAGPAEDWLSADLPTMVAELRTGPSTPAAE